MKILRLLKRARLNESAAHYVEICRRTTEKRPVITGIQRVSRPGRRIYSQKKEIPWVLSGMGISILTTPKGVMTGQKARKQGVGGEILCKVW